MSTNGDTTPTEHLHDSRREDPSGSDDSPIPGPVPTRLRHLRHRAGPAADDIPGRLGVVEEALFLFYADWETNRDRVTKELEAAGLDRKQTRSVLVRVEARLDDLDEEKGRLARELAGLQSGTKEVRGKLVTLSEIDAGHDAAIRETREALHGLKWIGAFAKKHRMAAGVVAFLIMTALQLLTLLRAAPSAPTLPPTAPSAIPPGVSR